MHTTGCTAHRFLYSAKLLFFMRDFGEALNVSCADEKCNMTTKIKKIDSAEEKDEANELYAFYDTDTIYRFLAILLLFLTLSLSLLLYTIASSQPITSHLAFCIGQRVWREFLLRIFESILTRLCYAKLLLLIRFIRFIRLSKGCFLIK